jgi:hypothetical protein
MARAWMEWRQNPTSENREAFERQKRIAEMGRWAFSGVVFAVLAIATVVYQLRRDVRDSTATGSQPIRSETNRAPTAADSRR